MADNFQQLLSLLKKAGVKDRFSQLDVAKVTWTFGHILIASRALELPIDGTQSRVVQSILTRLQLALVHRLRVQHVADTHILDLLRRQESELDFLDCAQRRRGVREVEVRHDDGCILLNVMGSRGEGRGKAEMVATRATDSRKSQRAKGLGYRQIELEDSMRRMERKVVVATAPTAAQAGRAQKANLDLRP